MSCALSAVLLRALDVMLIYVDADDGQVLGQHVRRVHAEREGGADAHIENLAKRREGGG